MLTRISHTKLKRLLLHGITLLSRKTRCAGCLQGHCFRDDTLSSCRQSGSSLKQYPMIELKGAAFLAANAVVTNAATAEEIVRGAILEALSSLRVLQPSGKFGVWLIQITVDRARKRIAEGDGKVQDPVQKPSIDDELDYVPQDLSSWRLIPSETLENTEHRLALEHAFVCLPQECREVLTLQDAAHLSHNETAEALGLSLRQVKTRLRRARLQLRDALAPGKGGRWSNGSALVHDQKVARASSGATGLSSA